jgi:hypothetical protein
MIQIYHSNNSRNPLAFETRRVQHNERSLMISLPMRFVDQLGILKGDLIRFYIPAEDKNKLILQKIDITSVE